MKKPLHKHIGHGLKKTHSQFTKYLYERDTIFATFWVFLFIVGLGSIPLNLGFLNPIKLNLKDFDFNDIYYSKVGKAATVPVDSNIVIIDIAQADREGIALMIEKTASYNPKVMGLDAYFEGPRDPIKDSLLGETFRRHKNLVVAVQYEEDTVTHKLVTVKNYFKDEIQHAGYVNFPYPKNDPHTIRKWFPLKMDHDKVIPSFSLALVREYNPQAAKILESKGDKEVLINYSRPLDQLDVKRQKYWFISNEDFITDNFEPSLITGKIALLAFVSADPSNIADKKFTPMNYKYYGKSVPDMDGIVVHANIISMALEKSYIKKLPLWLTVLIAILVCWLHMSFFIRYYLEDHIWFHLVAKIAQVASAIFFVWIGIYLFDRFQLKVDLKLSIVVIALSVDVIYFYEAFAVWMHKKYGFKTIFHQKHHH